MHGQALCETETGAGTANKLVKGSIFRNVDLFISLGVTFLITPFIVHSLGNRMYGFWTLVGTVIGYYGLLDFGLSSAATRYISQSLGKGDMEQVDRVANTAFFLFTLIGAAALLVTAACVLACPLFIRDPGESALFREIILMLGIVTAIGFPFKVYGGVLTSHMEFDSIAYISIARTVVANAAIYVFLRNGRGIMTVAMINCAASLLQSAATCALCLAQVPGVRVTFFRFDREKMHAMFDYSWKTFICQIGDTLRFQVDSFVIAAFLDVSLVTPYFIGGRLVDGFGRIISSSIGVMLPVFSQYEGRGDYESIRSALLKVTTLSALLGAFVGFSVIFYGKAFILRWMGPGFEGSYGVTVILCAGSILGLAEVPGVQLLYGLSKNNYLAAANACQAALNVLLSLFFLRHLGMYGVALATMVETMIFALFVQPIYICRTAQLTVRAYLVDKILFTLLKAAVPLGIYFYLIRDLVTPDFTRIGACIAVQAALFIPAAYFFIIGDDERRYVKNALQGRTKLYEKLGRGGGPINDSVRA
ncbi:MAG TPA: oligosaccharide flippase family protein [Elusimicrobiota bacterium]|nr:oligosaccharide flippase family protein [Elusimicrobiota bacterium]